MGGDLGGGAYRGDCVLLLLDRLLLLLLSLSPCAACVCICGDAEAVRATGEATIGMPVSMGNVVVFGVPVHGPVLGLEVVAAVVLGVVISNFRGSLVGVQGRLKERARFVLDSANAAGIRGGWSGSRSGSGCSACSCGIVIGMAAFESEGGPSGQFSTFSVVGTRFRGAKACTGVCIEAVGDAESSKVGKGSKDGNFSAWLWLPKLSSNLGNSSFVVEVGEGKRSDRAGGAWGSGNRKLRMRSSGSSSGSVCRRIGGERVPFRAAERDVVPGEPSRMLASGPDNGITGLSGDNGDCIISCSWVSSSNVLSARRRLGNRGPTWTWLGFEEGFPSGLGPSGVHGGRFVGNGALRGPFMSAAAGRRFKLSAAGRKALALDLGGISSSGPSDCMIVPIAAVVVIGCFSNCISMLIRRGVLMVKVSRFATTVLMGMGFSSSSNRA